MAGYYIEPTKSVLKSCYVKGLDFKQYAYTLRIYETVCKPYLTGQLIIIDNNNLLENMGIVGGEEVSLSFSAPPNTDTYACDLNILSMKGQQNPNNLKSQIYTIDLIGKTYFQDRASTVQSGHKGQTGTSAIQTIFGKYLSADSLSILVSSIGMIGDKEGYNVNNKKPFTAIDDIRKTLIFSGYKTGNSLMFRDRDNVKLAPLEYLLSSMGEQEFFIQKETWGKNFFDEYIYNSIIVAQAEATRSNAGRSGMSEIAAATKQSQVVFDMFKGDLVKNLKAIDAGSSFVGNIFGGAGNIGGAPNVQISNEYRTPRATAPDNKTIQERLYSANARNGPQLLLKVPLQTGINVTVGKGIRAQLLPPIGDQVTGNILSYTQSGLWLVTDLCHEIHTDSRQMNGTTTMQMIKGGFG